MIHNFLSYSTDIYLPSPMGIVTDTGLSWEENKCLPSWSLHASDTR